MSTVTTHLDTLPQQALNRAGYHLDDRQAHHFRDPVNSNEPGCVSPFTLNLTTRELRDETGYRIALRRKAMQALLIFAARPGETIRKEELFERLWPQACVTEDSLVQIIGDIRQALRDRHRELLFTRHRIGYCLRPDVIRIEQQEHELCE